MTGDCPAPARTTVRLVDLRSARGEVGWGLLDDEHCDRMVTVVRKLDLDQWPFAQKLAEETGIPLDLDDARAEEADREGHHAFFRKLALEHFSGTDAEARIEQVAQTMHIDLGFGVKEQEKVETVRKRIRDILQEARGER